MRSRTKLLVYAVAGVAAVAVVTEVAADSGNTFWAIWPAIVVAIFLAGRGGSCRPRRRGDDA